LDELKSLNVRQADFRQPVQNDAFHAVDVKERIAGFGKQNRRGAIEPPLLAILIELDAIAVLVILAVAAEPIEVQIIVDAGPDGLLLGDILETKTCADVRVQTEIDELVVQLLQLIEKADDLFCMLAVFIVSRKLGVDQLEILELAAAGVL